MSVGRASKSVMRSMKNVAHGYSETQSKVRSATSNDHIPPSGLQMHEIAVLSYNPLDYTEIIEIIDRRLNDKGKNWRHVYKSLAVLDYLLHSGSPAVAAYFRQNLYVVKTLTEFQYIDDTGRDVGADVRARARDITRLLMDANRIAEARRRRRRMRQRMQGRPVDSDSEDDEVSARKFQEDQLRKEREAAAKKQEKKKTEEELDMERALKLSEKEQEEHRKRLDKANAEALFDDNKQIGPSSLIDTSISPDIQQIAPQFTSIQPQYTQMQPQYTQYSLQPQYTQMQPQYTAYDPAAQQAQYDAMIQAEYARQQAEAQQQYQMQMLQQQQQQQQQKAVQRQTTANTPGSNNPFAQPSRQLPPSAPSSLYASSPVSSLSYQNTATSVPALTHRTSTASSYTSSQPPPTPVSLPDLSIRRSANENAQLAQLFANRTGASDGLDTFGNTGALRFGGTAYGQLAVQKTGVLGQATGSSYA